MKNEPEEFKPIELRTKVEKWEKIDDFKGQIVEAFAQTEKINLYEVDETTYTFMTFCLGYLKCFRNERNPTDMKNVGGIEKINEYEMQIRQDRYIQRNKENFIKWEI